MILCDECNKPAIKYCVTKSKFFCNLELSCCILASVNCRHVILEQGLRDHTVYLHRMLREATVACGLASTKLGEWLQRPEVASIPREELERIMGWGTIVPVL